MNCSICQFPWLWWAVTVVVAYLIGWAWYSVFFKKQWIALEKRSCNCDCGPDCTCGCQQGGECKCGPECGCHEGKECTCGADCKCHNGSMMPMIVQLGATALLGFVLFWATHINVWLAIGMTIAFCAWGKASIFFRAGWNRRGRNLVWIDVSYLAIVSLLFIVVAAAIGACAGCHCGAGCACGAGC